MTGLIVTNVLLIGLLVLSVLRHDKHTATLLAAHAGERDLERQAIQQERQAHAEERRAAHPDLTELVALVDRVCQRLQAPEQASADHSMQLAVIPPAAMPPAMNLDSDKDYWERIHGLSKEDLADNLEPVGS